MTVTSSRRPVTRRKEMVGTRGLEPLTSTVSRYRSTSRPLILKGLIAGRTGKTGTNGPICYQIATKITASGFRAEPWGISPFTSDERCCCHMSTTLTVAPLYRGVLMTTDLFPQGKHARYFTVEERRERFLASKAKALAGEPIDADNSTTWHEVNDPPTSQQHQQKPVAVRSGT